jgi:hypothetical protein
VKSAAACIFGILVFFVGCTKKTTAPAEIKGPEYYPLTEGRFVVYEVDSTVYGEIPRDTTVTRYLIKEKIAGTFTDNEGHEAYRLERYFKMYQAGTSYDSLDWKIKEVWMVNKNATSLQVQERNTRYTKLIFPVQENARWNGNAYNSGEELLYQYEYIDRVETINGVSLERVLKVKQKEYRTLISYESHYEKYAAGVGLAERGITAIYSNSIIPGQPVEKRIENGLVYRQILLNYGHE